MILRTWRSQALILFGLTAAVIYVSAENLPRTDYTWRLQTGVALALLPPLVIVGIASALGATRRSFWGAAAAPAAVTVALTITDPTSGTGVAIVIVLLISGGAGLGGAYVGRELGRIIQHELKHQKTWRLFSNR